MFYNNVRRGEIMNPDNEMETVFANLNENMPKVELDYLEVYSLVKELVSKPNKTTEDIQALAQGINYLTSMRSVYLESKSSGRGTR